MLGARVKESARPNENEHGQERHHLQHADVPLLSDDQGIFQRAQCLVYRLRCRERPCEAAGDDTEVGTNGRAGYLCRKRHGRRLR